MRTELAATGKELVEIETSQGPAAAATAQAVQDDLTPEELRQAVEDSLISFKEGDILAGTVVKVDRDDLAATMSPSSKFLIDSS